MTYETNNAMGQVIASTEDASESESKEMDRVTWMAAAEGEEEEHRYDREHTVAPENPVNNIEAYNLLDWDHILHSCTTSIREGELSLESLSFDTGHRAQLLVKVIPHKDAYDCRLGYNILDLKKLPRIVYPKENRRDDRRADIITSRNQPKDKIVLVKVKAETRQEAENISEGIRRICMLAPTDIDMLSTTAWISIGKMARRLAYPDRLAKDDPLVSVIEKLHRPAKYRGEWQIRADVVYFDDRTMHQRFHNVRLLMSSISLEAEIPEPVPRFVYTVVGQKAASVELGEDIVNNSIKLMRYIQSKLTGRLMDRVQAGNNLSVLLEQLTIRNESSI